MKELEQVKKALLHSIPTSGGCAFAVRTRRQDVVWARQVGMAALHDQYRMSLTTIAEAVGVNHGTVHHAVKRVRDTVQVDKFAQKQVRHFLKELSNTRRAAA